ncbi:hypothetical protein PCCS19_21060 [Paenibacillus sp. CCS19]|uniref:hypothetical protein n=1 Tax=Paenibacillus sp. CCS19 TaxID=3158387 RepID=UPI00256B1B64|nr:hypothetical protein [Paenibacillus cellulosilyticus]GMK39052.1 hypothetical protein PCCS19_21060 [Paenibacillus cellulosilyticus]
MAKLMTKAIVGVMYSRKTWTIYKAGVWFLEMLAFTVALMGVTVASLLLIFNTGGQGNFEVSETMRNTVVVSCMFLAGIFAYFRIMKFKPEEKVRKALEIK